MSDNNIPVAQVISWILSVSVFFAGVIFAIIGRANRKMVENNATTAKVDTERIRKLEIVMEVWHVQYASIMAAIAELKVAVKELGMRERE